MKSLFTRDSSRLKLEVLVRSSEISPSLVRRILLNSDDGRMQVRRTLRYRKSQMETCPSRVRARAQNAKSRRDSPVNQTPPTQTKMGAYLTDVGDISPLQIENLTAKKLDLGGLSSDFSRLRRVDPGLRLELKCSLLQLPKKYVRNKTGHAFTMSGVRFTAHVLPTQKSMRELCT